MSKSPEEELQEFLSGLPEFLRKGFQHGLASLTQNELDEWWKHEEKNPGVGITHLQQFERLLRCLPDKWREYRAREIKAWAQIGSSQIPPNPEGRPRREALAEKAKQLKDSGLSYTQIALRLKREDGAITGEQIRGLLKYRRRKSRKTAPPPEKT